ncbi:MAG: hypothetical protein V1867_08010 [Candidatus Falkowbacteria bacterium]
MSMNKFWHNRTWKSFWYSLAIGLVLGVAWLLQLESKFAAVLFGVGGWGVIYFVCVGITAIADNVKHIREKIEVKNNSFIETHRNTERLKYKCPHCGSRKNSFYASDSDMGHGPSFNVYRCECGRYFDEPPSGKSDVGLRRD